MSAGLQLPLPFPAPVWPAMGRWMMGDGPRPVELARLEAVRLVADAHRRAVRASWGGR